MAIAPVDHGNKEEEEEDSHSQLSVYYNSVNGLNGAGLSHRIDEALTKEPSFEGALRPTDLVNNFAPSPAGGAPSAVPDP